MLAFPVADDDVYSFLVGLVVLLSLGTKALAVPPTLLLPILAPILSTVVSAF